MSDLTDRLRVAFPSRHNLDACADLIDDIDGYTTTVPPDLPDNMHAEDGWAAAMKEIHRLIHPEAERRTFADLIDAIDDCVNGAVGFDSDRWLEALNDIRRLIHPEVES